MSLVPFQIRQATAADQPVIRAIVRGARINPLDLAWPRFQLAVVGEHIIGTVQVKPHRDGTRELASLAVLPQYQGEGVGRALVYHIQSAHAPPLYLTCAAWLEGFYEPLGFCRVTPAALPPSYGPIYALVNGFFRLLRRPVRLLVMRWDGARPL